MRSGSKIISYAAGGALALAMAGSANALGVGGFSVGGIGGAGGARGVSAPSLGGSNSGLPTPSNGSVKASHLPVIVLPTLPTVPVTAPNNVAGHKPPGSKPYGGPSIPPGKLASHSSGKSKSSLPVASLPTVPSVPVTVPNNVAGQKPPGSKPYAGPSIPPGGVGGHKI